jgi:hypothetical protein
MFDNRAFANEYIRLNKRIARNVAIIAWSKVRQQIFRDFWKNLPNEFDSIEQLRMFDASDINVIGWPEHRSAEYRNPLNQNSNSWSPIDYCQTSVTAAI